MLRRFSSVPNGTDFLRVPFVSSVVALVLAFGCGCGCGWAALRYVPFPIAHRAVEAVPSRRRISRALWTRFLMAVGGTFKRLEISA